MENHTLDDIIYLLSNKYNYTKMICSDAGPEYAKNRNWKIQNLGTEVPQNSVLVIDNRISKDDFPIIKQLIENNRKIILRVGDGMKETIEHENNNFLLSINPKDNIHFYSTYKNDHVLTLLKSKHHNRVFTIPYPYNKEKEISINNNRIKKVIVSGNLSSAAYPLRWHFHISTYHKLWALGKVKYLKHPGYSDLGFKLKHSFINDNYLDFLARYQYMLTTPSVYDYELLKFRECAYAGCCLVGYLPSTIEISKTKLPGLLSINDEINPFLKSLFSLKEDIIKQSIVDYRYWFRENRNPILLNNILLNKLNFPSS